MKIRSHRELEVYQMAYKASMRIFELSKSFPKVERYSLTDQIRRASRSVCANIAEAFRKRKYPKSFVLKLSDAEAEAAETQNWLDYALDCQYMTKEDHSQLDAEYDKILGKLVTMAQHPEKWSY